MNNNELNFSVTLTLKDYKTFCYSNLFKSSYGKVLVYLSIIFFVIAPFYFLYIFSTLENTPKIEAFYSLFIVILVFLIMIYLPLILLPFSVNKIYKNDKFSSEKGSYIISNQGINISSDSSTISIDWDKIYKIVEYKKIFAIFIALNKAFLIPKYVIEDKLDLFKEIIKNNLDKNKLKFRKK